MNVPSPTDVVEVPEARIGRTAQALRDETPIEPAWLIPGLLAPGSTTLLSGREKAGKGWFEAYLLGCLERGDPTIFGEAREPTRAIIFTEEPVHSLKEKYDLFDVTSSMVVYQYELAGRPWTEVIEWLVQNAVDMECGLVFIDNISDATGTQEESGKELTNYIKPLAYKAKELDLAVLFDHHMRKTGGKIEDLVRGSTALGAAVDQIIGLEKTGAGRERKLTSWGRLWATNWEKHIELSEDKTQYVMHEGDWRFRILVSKDAWDVKRFAAAIKASDDTARNYLNEHPQVEKVKGGADKGADLYIVHHQPEIA